ncbi:MAG: PepSY-like domain-containing protein [Mucinivorans sp.]
MKKLLLAILSLFALQSQSMASTARPIELNKLPELSQNFIKTYFSQTKPLRATFDNEILDKEYKVVFVNGSSVEFDGKGLWKEVDCQPNALPKGMVPAKIATYVVTTYPELKMVKIERESSGGYQVKLSNQIELEFNAAQLFVGIDD